MRRIATRITAWVEEYLEDNSLGDDVSWDLMCAMTPQGYQAQILFFMPSPVLGSINVAIVGLSNAVQFDRDEINGLVANALETLRQQRTTDVQAPGMPVMGNGGHGGQGPYPHLHGHGLDTHQD